MEDFQALSERSHGKQKRHLQGLPDQGDNGLTLSRFTIFHFSSKVEDMNAVGVPDIAGHDLTYPRYSQAVDNSFVGIASHVSICSHGPANHA